MGKNYPAEIAVRADIKETLRVLGPLISELGGALQSKRAAERTAQYTKHNWIAHRKQRAEVALTKAAAQSIDLPMADAHDHGSVAKGRNCR
jgi:benzoylformate decarboxylase